MDYELARTEAEKYYHAIGAVFSPALKEQIYFSNHGFRHILFKRGRKGRRRKDQMRRFSLLPLASELVGLSTTHQEFEVVLEARHRKMKSVRYWGIIAILHDEKIKVVIRRMGKSRRTPELKTPPWAAFLVCLGSALPNGTLVPQAHTHYGTWNIKKSLKEF